MRSIYTMPPMHPAPPYDCGSCCYAYRCTSKEPRAWCALYEPEGDLAPDEHRRAIDRMGPSGNGEPYPPDPGCRILDKLTVRLKA